MSCGVQRECQRRERLGRPFTTLHLIGERAQGEAEGRSFFVPAPELGAEKVPHAADFR